MHKLRLSKQKAVITPQTCQCAQHLTVFFILIFTSLIFTACSPQKRLDRLLKNHPELTSNDTITITTPIKVPEVNAEFLINYTYKDSLITCYTEDSIKMTYTVINDSIINVFFHVPADTIFQTIDVPVEKIKIIKPDNWGLFIEKNFNLILFLIIILIAFFLVLKIYKLKLLT